MRRAFGAPVWVSDKVALGNCGRAHTAGRGRFRPVSEKPPIILWGDDPKTTRPTSRHQSSAKKPKLVEESWGEKGDVPFS